jgi:hypothetical protein
MLLGVPARASHDYARHGTSILYGALDVTTTVAARAICWPRMAQQPRI